MPKVDSLLMQAIKLLSMRVAILEPFYSATSCMHVDERELIGYMASYIEMFGEDNELSLIFKHIFIPAVRKIGIARWPRLELTDLGFAISNKDSAEYDISSEEAVPMEEALTEALEKSGLTTKEA